MFGEANSVPHVFTTYGLKLKDDDIVLIPTAKGEDRMAAVIVEDDGTVFASQSVLYKGGLSKPFRYSEPLEDNVNELFHLTSKRFGSKTPDEMKIKIIGKIKGLTF